MSTLAVGGSMLRPLPIIKISDSDPVNIRIPFSVYSTFLNHGAVTGGNDSGIFGLGQIVTSSSGGIGQVVASTATTVQLNPIAGTTIFNAGDTLTQQTGSNAGATATQAGASSVAGPFAVGETVQSSLSGEAKGTGQIIEVNASDILITSVQGDFDSGDTLTQLTGAAAGDTTLQSGAASGEGLLAGQVVSVTYDLGNMINGRVRGNFHQDVEGELHVFYGNDRNNMDLDFDVPQDIEQPNFQYAFDIIIIQPFCRIEFTNGAGDGTYFRGFVSSLPV
jgi:hypothetical protein